MTHGPISPPWPLAMIAACPLLRPTRIDDAPRQHGKAPLLFIAQARPKGLRSVCKAHVGGSACGVRFATATQTSNQVGWRSRLRFLATGLHLDLRPLARSRLHRGPELLLIG